ncbi:MAG: DNA/RNA nuclease SfsA [Deltaproteobacteria bacterium]|nr:DNA/RNA nuclease SfsA [Deltaproteobacteria bacterium]
MATSFPIPGPVRPARFVDRPNRFIVRARLDPDDLLITAHLPDPGRLKELLTPGARMWVRSEADPTRKTEWTAVLLEHPGGLIALQTTLANDLVHRALVEETLTEVEGWNLERPEAAIGRSRFDFLLSQVTGEKMVLEVKSVTMVDGQIARFPDAPSERAARHLKEMAELASKTGWFATAVFVVQRVDAHRFSPAKDIDPAFAAALAEAKAAGVRLVARRCQVTLAEMVLGMPLPVVL